MLAPAIDPLIKEARERQHRRRLSVVAAVTLTTAAGVLGYSLDRGSDSQTRAARPGSAAFALSPACAQSRHPRLFLSRRSGSPGTHVSAVACGCPRADLFLVEKRHTGPVNPATGVPLRRIRVTRASRRSAMVTYVVSRRDMPGRGVLEIRCGGLVGNAVGFFRVIR